MGLFDGKGISSALLNFANRMPTDDMRIDPSKPASLDKGPVDTKRKGWAGHAAANRQKASQKATGRKSPQPQPRASQGTPPKPPSVPISTALATPKDKLANSINGLDGNPPEHRRSGIRMDEAMGAAADRDMATVRERQEREEQDRHAEENARKVVDESPILKWLTAPTDKKALDESSEQDREDYARHKLTGNPLNDVASGAANNALAQFTSGATSVNDFGRKTFGGYSDEENAAIDDYVSRMSAEAQQSAEQQHRNAGADMDAAYLAGFGFDPVYSSDPGYSHGFYNATDRGSQYPADARHGGVTATNAATGELVDMSDLVNADAGLNPYDEGQLARAAEAEQLDRQMGENEDYMRSVIDDGSQDIYNLTSDIMTGAQYIKYRERMGIPGRPVDEIDPNGVYSKHMEQGSFGFVPYHGTLSDGSSPWLQTHDLDGNLTIVGSGALLNEGSAFFDRMANFRSEDTPWPWTDANGNVHVGQDLFSSRNMQRMRNYLNDWQLASQENAADHIVDEPVDGNVNIPIIYANVDPDTGEPFYGTIDFGVGGSNISWDPDSRTATIYAYEDGSDEPSFSKTFQTDVDLYDDGGQSLVDQINDWTSRIDTQMIDPDGTNEQHATGWLTYPKFTDDAGFSYTPEELSALVSLEQSGGGGTVTLSDGSEVTFDPDYGRLNWAKPASAMQDESLAGRDFVPQTFDMLMGSAPLFTRYTSAPWAGANFFEAMQNVSQSGWTGGGGRRLMSEPTAGNIGTASVANATMPVTEMLAGGITGGLASTFGKAAGKSVMKSAFGPLQKRIMKRTGKQGWHPWADYAADVGGEAVEEIPGNIWEQGSQVGYGQNWYANPVLDENGNAEVDRFGNIVYDKDTSASDRMRNFASDIPDAMLGGGVLGGLMSIPSLPGTVSKSKEYRAEKGRQPYYEADEADEYEPLSEEEMRRRGTRWRRKL